MEPRKSRFWIVVLTGVIILSGGLPLGDRRGAAQPLPPGAIKEPASLSQALEANDEHLNYVLNQLNSKLEEKAYAEGRGLQESERIRVIRRVVLQPHPTSPVQDLIVEAWELSDGTKGSSFSTPTFQPWVKGPFGYKLETMNLDEGWYIVRFATPEEIQDATKEPEATEPVPATESEPLSFLQHVIGFLSPSEALACPCSPQGACQQSTPYQHSVYEPLYDNAGPLLARDGVKMQWIRNTCCQGQILSTDKRCEVFGAWQYLAPCEAVTTGFAFPFSVWVNHRDQYVSPAGSTNVFITSRITGAPDGSWGVQGSSCSISGPLSSSIHCGPPILDPF